MASVGETCTQCWVGSLQLHEGMLVCDVCGSIHQVCWGLLGRARCLARHAKSWLQCLVWTSRRSSAATHIIYHTLRPNTPGHYHVYCVLAQLCQHHGCGRQRVVWLSCWLQGVAEELLVVHTPMLAAGLCRGDSGVPDGHQRCAILQVSLLMIVTAVIGFGFATASLLVSIWSAGDVCGDCIGGRP